MPSSTLPLPLHASALHLRVEPGTRVVLRGSYYSAHDGSVVDAATTTWPDAAPGKASVDVGGLVDLEAGGFHLLSRDPESHVVEAVATGGDAPGCAHHGVPAPCLPLRTAHQAHARLLTAREWAASLKGGIEVQTVTPPAGASIAAAATPLKTVAIGLAVALTLAVAVAVAVLGLWHRRRSPRSRLLALLRRVRRRVRAFDPVLAAALGPALAAARGALRRGRLDPSSTQGKRVEQAFRQLDATLGRAARRQRMAREQRAADELIGEVKVALAAARETASACGESQANPWPMGQGADHEAQTSCCGSL